MNLILRLRPSVSILALLLITMTGLTVNAQNTPPTLTISEDMPLVDITVKQVTYGNGVYLACLIHPTRLYRSGDGLSWSKIAGPDLGADTNINNYRQLSSIAYGAGRFVLTSDSGRIFSSTDLLTWTASASGTTHNIVNVKYLGNTFYAVGDSATFLTSPDGLSWTAQQIGIGDPTGIYQDIFSGNGHLVITAYNNIGTPNGRDVLYDSTGGLWTADSSRFYFGHGFAKGRFYEFAPDSISVSTDMQHWTATSISPDAGGGAGVFEDSAHVYLLTNNYVLVNASPTLRANISSSDDGINFGPLFLTGVYGGGAAYFNHRYFIFGGVTVGPMAGSADGLHYRILGRDTSLVVTNGSGYVKLSTTPEEAHLYTSPDLTHWTARDTLTGVLGLTYDGTRYWAVGTQTYTSTDGISWVNMGPSPHSFTGIAYGNGIYIAWSPDPNLGPDSLWYSPNGVSWTQSSTPTESNPPQAPPTPINYGHIKRVRFLNGRIFAVGDGKILYATDPATYSLDYAGNDLGQYRADVAYDADSAKYFFFAWGNGNGTLPPYLTTASTADPFVPASITPVTDTISGLPSDMQLVNFQSVIYDHGHFTSVIDNRAFPPYPSSYLIWSRDGTHWGSQMLDRETQFTSAITRNDTFYMAGTHNYEILADFSGSIPLPVTLLNFNATAEHNTTVLLTWQTAIEQNSRSFVIQRSTPANAKWENIGSVTAAGNSSSLRDYTFTDDNPAPGLNSYRLQLLDADNTSRFSEIRTVYLRQPTNITLYPNPAKDHLTIRTTIAGEKILTLYDPAGRETLRQTFNSSTLTLSLGNLMAGNYYLVIRLPDGSQHQYPVVHLK